MGLNSISGHFRAKGTSLPAQLPMSRPVGTSPKQTQSATCGRIHTPTISTLADGRMMTSLFWKEV